MNNRGRDAWISRLLPGTALALLLWGLLGPRPDLRVSGRLYEKFLGGEAFGAVVPPPELRFAVVDGPARGAEARGAIFSVLPAVRPWFYGTYVGGRDAFVGTLRSEAFELRGTSLYLPVAGYPVTPGNALALCILSANGEEERRIVYPGPNLREALGLWEVDVRALAGRRAVVEMRDGLAAPGGWLGVGRPIFSRRVGLAGARPEDFSATWGSYGYFALAAGLVATLLFLPGAVWGRWRGRALEPGFAALPGLGLLAAFGLALWLGRAGAGFGWGKGLLAVLAVGAGGLVVSPLRVRVRKWRPWAFYAGVCALALGYSCVPLPIAGESFAGANTRGRMLASPPDNATPYVTGVFFFHGLRGREKEDLYFGEGWTLTSRGPLVPLGVCGALNVFGLTPRNPPQSGEFAWPADEEGFFVARILGVLTNALVVLGVGALAARLGGNAGLAWGWASLSVVVLVNTVYVWPKLLAGYLVTLACALVLEGGAAWVVGSLLAGSYLAHPVAALLLPGIGMWRVQLVRDAGGGWRRALGAGAALAGATLAFLLPWLAFKWSLGAPDTFARYPLGDGRGYQTALGLGSWLATRARNVWFTLVPGAFYFSSGLPEWFDLPVRGAVRWSLAATKAFPGHLGIVLVWVAYAAALRREAVAAHAAGAFRGWVLFGNFALMVLIWGFSGDGLGRCSLEPLSVLLLAYAAARTNVGVGWRRAGLVALALETAWVLGSAFWLEPRFSPARLGPREWAAFGALGAGFAALLVLAWVAAGERGLTGAGRVASLPGAARR